MQRRWKPHPGSLLAVLWPMFEAEFDAAGASTCAAGLTGREHGARGVRSVACRSIGRRANALGLPDANIAAPRCVREETPVFDWAGETARRVGSLVHAELQVMDLEHSDEAAIRARDVHFKRWLALHGVPDERLHDASARVIAALIGVQRDPRGRWILQKGYRDDLREHAVSGHWRGEVVRAVFDRSFVDEHGVRWVIDYKTSQHVGGGLEEFLRARSSATGRSYSAMRCWRKESGLSPCASVYTFRSCAPGVNGLPNELRDVASKRETPIGSVPR